MRARSPLFIPFLAGVILATGCGPQQEYNSTDTVKTNTVPVPPRPAKVNKPETTPKRAASTKPLDI